MTEILAASKSAKNVLTATDPNDFIFHSSYNTFKILATGIVSISSSAGTTVTSVIAHGLGTRNGFLLLWNPGDDTNRFHDAETATYTANAGTHHVDTTHINIVTGHMDSTNLTIEYFCQDTGDTVYVKYYIFEVII